MCMLELHWDQRKKMPSRKRFTARNGGDFCLEHGDSLAHRLCEQNIVFFYMCKKPSSFPWEKKKQKTENCWAFYPLGSGNQCGTFGWPSYMFGSLTVFSMMIVNRYLIDLIHVVSYASFLPSTLTHHNGGFILCTSYFTKHTSQHTIPWFGSWLYLLCVISDNLEPQALVLTLTQSFTIP